MRVSSPLPRLWLGVFLCLSLFACVLPLPVASQSVGNYSCLCGCCLNTLQQGLCVGDSDWLGWFDENTAPCLGQPAHDVSVCDKLCPNGYPNQCEQARVITTCQLTNTPTNTHTHILTQTHTQTQTQTQTQIQTQAQQPSLLHSQNAKSDPLTSDIDIDIDESLQLQRVAQENRHQLIQLLDEQADQLLEQTPLNQSEVDELRHSLEKVGVVDDISLAAPPSSVFPFYTTLACECLCCNLNASTGNYTCQDIDMYPPSIMGFQGVPFGPMPPFPAGFNAICTSLCFMAAFKQKLPYACPYFPPLFFGIGKEQFNDTQPAQWHTSQEKIG